MNKVELAKMIGLEISQGQDSVVKPYEINQLLETQYLTIEREFLDGKIKVVIDAEDFYEITKGILDQNEAYKCGYVTGIIWERAADEYLARVHNAAMVIGN